jgi:hypothetical protein
MSLELDIYLNQLAQGVKPLSAGEQWFLQLPEEAQVDALRRLASHAMQAGAVGNDVAAAVSASGLKSSYTPCSMLTAHTKDQLASSALRVAMSRVIALPAPERRKTFLLLIALLSVADRRRRERDFDPARHWWHRDLSDERVVADILARPDASDQARLV